MDEIYVRVICGLDPAQLAPREEIVLPVRPCSWTGVVRVPRRVYDSGYFFIYCPRCGSRLEGVNHVDAFEPAAHEAGLSIPWVDCNKLYLLISRNEGAPRWYQYMSRLGLDAPCQMQHGYVAQSGQGPSFRRFDANDFIMDRAVARDEEHLKALLSQRLPRFMQQRAGTDIPAPDGVEDLGNADTWLVFVNGVLRTDWWPAERPVLVKSSTDITRQGTYKVITFEQVLPQDFVVLLVDILTREQLIYKNGSWELFCRGSGPIGPTG